ncbi:peroxidase 42-like [Salvia hispanica]|uniref:peroxidase 42-like n=1 Tax=Salvia hispanica TaxID=49212 RepID=UPI002008FF14|nr:peroxidase 42-like [Salvia hispanica]
MCSICKALFILTVLYFSSLSAFAVDEATYVSELSFEYYKGFCPHAENIIREQVQLLYNRHHAHTAFSWLRNVFHHCVFEECTKRHLSTSSISCDALMLLESTRREMSEKEEADGSYEMRSFRYVENIIREAIERDCPDGL